MAVDRNGVGTLSEQVAADIVQRIRSGEYALNSKIPSLRAMSSTYGVAELTVLAAVKDLQQRGVLESEAGRGTFVRTMPDEPAPADPISELRSSVASLREAVEDLQRRMSDVEERD